ncbi:MAG: hypothetical protein U5R49_15460 [Deltaproteobacteria bacterium]|nr:hypothetical protein [Deltaproteobacteria bacterium]
MGENILLCMSKTFVITDDGKTIVRWKRSFFLRSVPVFALLWCLFWPIPVWSDHTTHEETAKSVDQTWEDLAAQWGIRPVALRLTGANHFLDFRYVIVDPEKAKAVLSRNKKNQTLFLLDQKTGKKLPVPVTKLGPLRATAISPKKGRQYTILFSNVGKSIKKGDRVSVVIGKFRAENLIVE